MDQVMIRPGDANVWGASAGKAIEHQRTLADCDLDHIQNRFDVIPHHALVSDVAEPRRHR
jgi:hypothetical protein